MADALSRKPQHRLNTVVITQLHLLKKLKDLGVQLVSHDKQVFNYLHFPCNSLVEDIRVNQEDDLELQLIKQNPKKQESPNFAVYEDRTLRFLESPCLPKNVGIRK